MQIGCLAMKNKLLKQRRLLTIPWRIPSLNGAFHFYPGGEIKPHDAFWVHYFSIYYSILYFTKRESQASAL